MLRIMIKNFDACVVIIVHLLMVIVQPRIKVCCIQRCSTFENNTIKLYDTGLRHQCGDTDDCEDYMICRADNATKTTLAKGVKDYSMKEKLCLCDEDNGYVENIVDKHCSGKQDL